jgi:hypothetical protein
MVAFQPTTGEQATGITGELPASKTILKPHGYFS